jgi:hypothetical protein
LRDARRTRRQLVLQGVASLALPPAALNGITSGRHTLRHASSVRRCFQLDLVVSRHVRNLCSFEGCPPDATATRSSRRRLVGAASSVLRPSSVWCCSGDWASGVSLSTVFCCHGKQRVYMFVYVQGAEQRVAGYRPALACCCW